VNRDLRQFQSDAGKQDQLDAMDLDLTPGTLFQLLEEKVLEVIVARQEQKQRAAADQ
jgi:hypothetical protein